ncbi:MAG: galactose-1-phosphate uridylyltransferase [Nitrososphaeria archaeon]
MSVQEKFTHEIRFNPLISQWIIVAGHRGKRPWQPSTASLCPFCPSSNGTKDLASSQVIVLPNRFPALVLNPMEPSSKGKFFKGKKAFGVCEVIVETTIHEGDLCDLCLDNVKAVIDTFANEFERLSNIKGIKYVAEFRNKGKEIGVSLTHPHSQIYALPFIPPRIMQELKSFEKYYTSNRRCLLCDILKEEVSRNERIIYLNKYFVALLPYYAQWPYEIHIYPKKHVDSVCAVNYEERIYLADILRVVTKTYNTLFEKDLPYIMVFHQRPTNKKTYFHMHVEFYQPYREREKMKFAAGIEWGFWVFTYDGVPSENVEELRIACEKALQTMDKYLGKVISK